MGSGPRQVVLTAAAETDLNEIWRWNADHYDRSRADKYTQFLRDSLVAIAATARPGKSLPGNSDLRYILLRRKSRGHGHIAVFKPEPSRIVVLQIFHTAQDWQSEITDVGE